jgi:hypothetical protein
MSVVLCHEPNADAACPCDDDQPVVVSIAAGLDALPRQLQAFPEVREALLRALPGKPALDRWRGRGQRDLGVMWLEMWAYVADVLGFYDERIANESYLRTAQLRPSLRRLVELLGFIPKPGLGGSVQLALIAEGRTQVTIPAGTAFRSDAFGNEPPQVFEATRAVTIHPLASEWSIGAIRRPTDLVPSPTPTVPDPVAGASGSLVSTFAFEVQDFGLNAPDRFALFVNRRTGASMGAAKVRTAKPFEGKDKVTYVEVELQPGVPVSGTAPADLAVSTPTVVARVSPQIPHRDKESNDPDLKFQHGVVESASGHPVVYLDAVYRQLHAGDLVITAESAQVFSVRTVLELKELPVDIKGTNAIVPVTRVMVSGAPILATATNEITFHFVFVPAGTVTTVAHTEVTSDDLRGTDLPIAGNVTPPPGALLPQQRLQFDPRSVPTIAGIGAQGKAARNVGPRPTTRRDLIQKFLLADAADKGALVTGVMRFFQTGRATFSVTDAGDPGLPSPLATPVSIFGNVIEATRGESVVNEVLGGGDPRQPNQQFQLKRKPLTYLGEFESTLRVRVSGVEWREVRSFFNSKPEDEVYIVRHNDAQETIITFGDGVRGARLPAGAGNVVANYRFGSGFVVPPAGAITQVARPVDGLRAVLSPIAARPGRDPDSPRDLRTNAARSMLLLQRAVSVADFEALANQSKGVVKAIAEYVWLDDPRQTGVRIVFIGSATKGEVTADLRKHGDPDLLIDVTPAQALPRTLELTVTVRQRLDPKAIGEEVRRRLADEPDGLLAAPNAIIGGELWVSRIYEVAHSVDGVVSVDSAVLLGDSAPPALAKTDVVCVPAKSYFDFSSGRVRVTARESSDGGN